MPTSLSASVALSLAAQFANSLDVGSVTYPVQFSPNYIFTDGSGANQANKIWTDTRTIAASGNDDLDLSGVLADAFGSSILFTRIKALIVVAAAANVNDVVIGAAAANQVSSIFGATTHTIKVKPGGAFMIVAPDATGYAITAATADILRIANGAGGSGVDYTIAIVGTV